MASTPSFAGTPKRQAAVWLPATTANTTNNGTGTIGTNILLAYTAGASGSYIDRIRLHPTGAVAATATTATVGRIYFSTVTSGATTDANTHLWQEVACPAQTTDQTTIATSSIEVPMGVRIGANETVLFSMHHAAAANTSWKCTVLGMDY